MSSTVAAPNFHSQHQCGRIPCALHSLQHLLFVEFLPMAILISVRGDTSWKFWFAFLSYLVMLTSFHVFFFKQWELNLFKLASWINIQNIFPVLNIFPMTSPRTFLEGRYFSLTALQALGILSAHEQWFQSCCYGKWPQGGSMSFCPTVVTEGTRALGKVWFLDCQNGRCQKKNLRLVYRSSSFLTASPGHIPVPATPLWGGCFHP